MHSLVMKNNETVAKRHGGNLQLLLRQHFFKSRSEAILKYRTVSRTAKTRTFLFFWSEMSNYSPSHAAGSGMRIFLMTHLTVTFVALMFTTIHCKIKRILIVVICYLLGGGSKATYQVDSIHTCSNTFSYFIHVYLHYLPRGLSGYFHRRYRGDFSYCLSLFSTVGRTSLLWCYWQRWST